MKRWLPTAPLEDITPQHVEAFLRAGHPESNTHEYKLAGTTGRIAEEVSALANTHGGIILVGVPDKWSGDLTTLHDVTEDAEDRIVDQLVDSLDPNWLPDIVPVHVANTRLLVLRVDAATAPRPVLAGGRGYLKRQRRKVVASRFDLSALFQSSYRSVPSYPALQARSLGAPTDVSHLVPTRPEAPEVAFRMTAGSPAWAEDLADADTHPSARDRLLAILDSVAVREWLERFAADQFLAVGAWHETGPSNRNVASFGLELKSTVSKSRRGQLRAYAHVQADVRSDATSPSGGGLATSITILLWPTSIGEDRCLDAHGSVNAGRAARLTPHLTVHSVGDTLDTLLETCDRVLDGLEDIYLPTVHPRLGPAAWLVGNLDTLIDLRESNLRQTEGIQTSNHAAFHEPRSYPRPGAPRADVVNTWLRNWLFTLGFVPGDRMWP